MGRYGEEKKNPRELTGSGGVVPTSVKGSNMLDSTLTKRVWDIPPFPAPLLVADSTANALGCCPECGTLLVSRLGLLRCVEPLCASFWLARTL